MNGVRNVYQTIKTYLAPARVLETVRQWKHRLVRVLWKAFGYIPKPEGPAKAERTFRFNDGGSVKEIQLSRPFFNDELPSMSFELFLRDLNGSSPEDWVRQVFSENRERLLRFRPSQFQTKRFLAQMRTVMSQLPDLERRSDLLAALDKLSVFNERQPELCVAEPDPALLTFGLALRLYDTGLMTAQTRLSIAGDIGFSGTKVCGPHALMAIFNDLKPKAFTEFTLDLFEHGRAQHGRFRLHVPTVLKTNPEHLSHIPSLERTLLGSFISTYNSLTGFRGTSRFQVVSWMKKMGWKNAFQFTLWHGRERYKESYAKAEKLFSSASFNNPVLYGGDSSLAIDTLPEEVNTERGDVGYRELHRDRTGHFIPIYGYEDLGDDRVSLTIANYGRICTVQVSKAKLFTYTSELVLLDEPAMKPREGRRAPPGARRR